MNKTLRLSFSLQNAYRVNTILYAIKQIPLLKRLLPDSLYACGLCAHPDLPDVPGRVLEHLPVQPHAG